MARKFLTHFSTVFFLHMALIFGGLTLIEQEVATQNLGQRMMTLKLAGEILLNPAPVKKTRPQTPRAQQINEASPEVRPGEAPQTPSALSGQTMASLKDLYKSELRAKIEENKYYPAASRRLGHTGTVIVAFTLLNDGSIINARIENTSGNPRLDSAGLDAVKKVKRFKPIPTELATDSMDVSVPILFR